MVNKDLLQSIDNYIDKYYVPERDDIVFDKKMESTFDKITRFLTRKKEDSSATPDEPLDDYEICEEAVAQFDASSMTKEKLTTPLAATIATNRKLDDLMGQMEETFSQRLLRMIDERDLTDSEAYTKALVDRRHFSKIRNDIHYAPNKKTVLAFCLALELSVDECKDLLGCAGFALSRSSKVDIIVAYCLQNKIYDMIDVNEILYEYEQPCFG